MTTANGKAKDLALKDARDIKGGKKTAAERQAAFEKFLRDKDVTDAEYWALN
jgi:hypothetical protein